MAQKLKESRSQFKRRRDVKRVNQVKIGHGGTLDPLATGVLILGIGSATKSLAQFLDCTKTYEAVVVFGASTDSYDRLGRIISKRPYGHITKDKVLDQLQHFRGKRKQTPPLFSALKMDGKPLYEYAREGKPIPREIAARDVEAHEVELIEWYEPGTHNHRWPTVEAEPVERDFAEQVWRVKRLQQTYKPLTPEEKAEDDRAMAAHESFKRNFETRQDELIVDNPGGRRRAAKEPLMSGALASPRQPGYSTKGANLVPPAPDKDAPPPWSDQGPPACKVRLTVTSGYYVRSFCHDLGALLGSAAIMAELCRVRQSDFTVGGINTLDFADLAKGEAVWGPKVADMLARWNGEPEGHWTAARPAQAADRSPPAGKRKRDPARDSASPVPRKVRAAPDDESGGRVRSAASPKPARPDDKSWDGIED